MYYTIQCLFAENFILHSWKKSLQIIPSLTTQWKYNLFIQYFSFSIEFSNKFLLPTILFYFLRAYIWNYRNWAHSSPDRCKPLIIYKRYLFEICIGELQRLVGSFIRDCTWKIKFFNPLGGRIRFLCFLRSFRTSQRHDISHVAVCYNISYSTRSNVDVKMVATTLKVCFFFFFCFLWYYFSFLFTWRLCQEIFDLETRAIQYSQENIFLNPIFLASDFLPRTPFAWVCSRDKHNKSQEETSNA